VTPNDDPLQATPMSGPRLLLEPLRVEHAEQMASVLGDVELYTFTGGSPPTVAELRDRYARQCVGQSEDGSEWWLNWVVARRDDGDPIGFVQATVSREAPRPVAEIAWVIGLQDQHQGYAREAARLLVDWLRRHRVAGLVAHIHPDHVASAAVAEGLGLLPTRHVEDGEVRWQGVPPAGV